MNRTRSIALVIRYFHTNSLRESRILPQNPLNHQIAERKLFLIIIYFWFGFISRINRVMREYWLRRIVSYDVILILDRILLLRTMMKWLFYDKTTAK